MPKVRKATDGFNLAFLDVMACGLGAVILIFILVDFNAFTPMPVSYTHLTLPTIYSV